MSKNHTAHGHANAVDHTEEQRQEQSEHRWQDFLNNNWGVLGFPFGIGCLTTKTPSVNAFLAILVITALWARGRHQVPKHFLPESRGGTPDHRPWSKRWKFWAGTVPALLGYGYLCFIWLSQPVAAYCDRTHACSWFIWIVNHYIGAPQ
ncbi:hypothetical protein ACFONN_10275 [Dyella humi]|uniref:Uncharacterized protein n=1 Tax=Dyella humi TaxID=1770547 RepID=A0ABW8IL88_9GAMM